MQDIPGDDHSPFELLYHLGTDLWRQAGSDEIGQQLAASCLDACVELGCGRIGESDRAGRLACFENQLKSTELRYQPIVRLDDRSKAISVVSHEALLRHMAFSRCQYASWAVETARLWDDDFTRALDVFVARQAIDHLRKKPGSKTSVNVHWSSTAHDEFASGLTAALKADRPLDPATLTLELSEVDAPDHPTESLHESLPHINIAVDDYPRGRLTEQIVFDFGEKFTYLKLDGWIFGQPSARRDVFLSRAGRLVQEADGVHLLVAEWVNTAQRVTAIARQGVNLVQFREFGDAEFESALPDVQLSGRLKQTLARAYSKGTTAYRPPVEVRQGMEESSHVGH